jgi:TRAP-type C4-dicarboxylate transport system permease large subunit
LKIGAFLSLGEGNATSDFVKGIVGSATVWPPATQIHTVLFNLTMFVVLAMIIVWPEIALWLPHHMTR